MHTSFRGYKLSLVVVMLLVLALGTMLAPGASAQAFAVDGAGYSVTLVSPAPPEASASFTWEVTGVRPGAGREIRWVVLSGCWTKADVLLATTDKGVVAIQSDGSVKVSNIGDRYLPVRIGIVFRNVYSSRSSGTNAYLKLGLEPTTGQNITVGGPTCIVADAQVSGRVFRDVNLNGKWDKGIDQGVATRVTLTSPDGVLTMNTKPNGRFVFAPLAPGKYTCHADIPSGETLMPDEKDTKQVKVAAGERKTRKFLLSIPAPDGSGALTIDPTEVAAGTSNTLQLAFTAPADSSLLPGSRVEITVPDGWTAPQTSDVGAAGFVSVAPGSPACHDVSIASVVGRVITLDCTCPAETGFALTYANATAPGTLGLCTFSARSANAGGTLTALASSPTVGVMVGPPAELTFGQQPTDVTAGEAITPSVTVRILDQSHNLCTTSTASVTLALGNNPGGATLGGTLTRAAVGGIATFDDLSVDKVGTDYALTATVSGLPVTWSTTFDVGPGPAAALRVEGMASPIAAGSAQTVTVTALDAWGNVATGYRGTVRLSSSDAGAVLPGDAAFVAADAGVRSISGVQLCTAGTQSLTATDVSTASITGAQTGIVVTAGAPAALAFGQQPTDSTAGAPIDPAVTVRIEDAYGNLTASTANVSLAIGTNPASGTLSGTTTLAAVGGIATFDDLSIDKAGMGYALSASSSGLTGAMSQAFVVTAGPAKQLAFDIQPTNSTTGVALALAVTVRVEDAHGNVCTTSTALIALELGNNPGNAALCCPLANAVNGIATFPDVMLTISGSGYTLRAMSTGLTSAESTVFDIAPGPVTHLVISGPSSATAGQAKTFMVYAADAYNNQVSSYRGTVHFTASDASAVLPVDYTFTEADAGGKVFSYQVTLYEAGAQWVYVVDKVNGAINGMWNFAVYAGASTRLRFEQSPTEAVAGVPFSPPVKVRIEDAYGNLCNSSTLIYLGIGDNPGWTFLDGTLAVVASGGIATFDNAYITIAATGYTLRATGADLEEIETAAFKVVPAAAASIDLSYSPSVTAGSGDALEVVMRDAYDNVATGYTGTLHLTSSDPAAILPADHTFTDADQGVYAFNDVTLCTAGEQWVWATDTVSATLTQSVSTVVYQAEADHLEFTWTPSSAQALGQPISPCVQVDVHDAYHNLVDTGSYSITMALGNNPTGATLGGTTTLTTSDGVACFDDLTVSAEGTGYWLEAAAEGLIAAISNAFDILAP